MASPFLGEIKMFAGNFAPRGYAFCNGQILAINQNSALFSLLGTMYGGNGQTTFALPNLQGRVPVHFGQGIGLSTYSQGQVGGVEHVTLTQNEIPLHTHALRASSAAGTDGVPGTNQVLAASTARDKLYSSNAANTTLSTQALGTVGGSQPHTNLQPYLAINFIIALEGIFPSRN